WRGARGERRRIREQALRRSRALDAGGIEDRAAGRTGRRAPEQRARDLRGGDPDEARLRLDSGLARIEGRGLRSEHERARDERDRREDAWRPSSHRRRSNHAAEPRGKAGWLANGRQTSVHRPARAASITRCTATPSANVAAAGPDAGRSSIASANASA